MLAFLRRLFRRTPKPAITGVYLSARTSGTEPWTPLGTHKSIHAAQQAAEMHAGNECFRTGRVVYFEFKYDPQYEENVK